MDTVTNVTQFVTSVTQFVTTKPGYTLVRESLHQRGVKSKDVVQDGLTTNTTMTFPNTTNTHRDPSC